MPKYRKISIWYFSGTGNARFAAHKIAERAGQKGIEVSVNNIADTNPDFSNIDDQSLIGFCYPTHGFNASPIVLKFLTKFPKGRSDVFLLNTRAGLKLFSMHLPGIGGIALWLPALILLLKGYKPIGFRPLDMPSNWIFLHPGLTTRAVDFITRRCATTLHTFTNQIIRGKPVLNGFIWLPLDIFMVPLSIGYYFVGRFVLAKTLYANYNCNLCNLCIRECPVKAVKEIDKRPYWTFDCESCMKCINNCPQRAIETAHSYSFVLWWLAFSLIPWLLIMALEKSEIIPAGYTDDLPDWFIQIYLILTGLIVIFFGYKILHQLLRVRFLNKIITFTSLSHFRFWNRYMQK